MSIFLYSADIQYILHLYCVVAPLVGLLSVAVQHILDFLKIRYCCVKHRFVSFKDFITINEGCLYIQRMNHGEDSLFSNKD